MVKAKHQATWRANSQKTRVEIYLNSEELARLDGLGGTRAEAIRRLLWDIPPEPLDQLHDEFLGDQEAGTLCGKPKKLNLFAKNTKTSRR